MTISFVMMIMALLAGSVGSVLLASLVLLFKGSWLQKLSEYLMYLAGGTLLGAAFLGMIPNAVAQLNVTNTLEIVLIGILFFFLLEKIILWRTCANQNCERRNQTTIPMILIGDAFHNAIDGIVIASAFLSSPELGFFVTLSVIMHEIPQELADFGILIHGGMSKRKALWYNALSGSSAILVGILAWFFLQQMTHLVPYALAFSASSFLYIAMAELIPEMHKKTKVLESLVQLLLIVAGILIIFLIKHTH